MNKQTKNQQAGRVKRINFIEKEPFVLTYRKMMMIGAASFAMAFLFSGMQMGRAALLNKKARHLEVEINKLKAEKDRRLREAIAAESEAKLSGSRKAILNFLEEALPWPLLLRELASRTPQSVWLATFDSQSTGGVSRSIHLTGYSLKAAQAALFAKAISESPYFKGVTLKSLQQEVGVSGERYRFEIDFEAMSDKVNKSVL
jgi:Tfp pilus assembly protein PilN